ncbi:MAG: M20/M25/M40 family metallo-hydrolase [Ornithinimicrobium sp.]
MPPEFLASATDRLPQMLADIERLITLETPSSDHAAVAIGAADVAALIQERLGLTAQTLHRDGVTHLRLKVTDDPAVDAPARVVLLCHQDTVWPHGTLDRLPFSTADGVLRGPGSFDMLTGLVMAIHAVAMLQHAGMPTAGISLLITGDEEVGSATSRELIVAEVTGAQDNSLEVNGTDVKDPDTLPAVLVLEASADGGAVKVGRKGASSYRVTATARAAHAGLEPENGINAGVELAHQVLRIAELADDDAGTSVVPTTLAGGSSSNTVPATAYLDVDSRAWTEDEQRRVDAALHALTPTQPGARLEVSGGINRPPLQREHSMGLYAVLARVCDELGVPTPEAADVGGASDGNITAGLGAPTLDGLGAVGAGAHADHEHALIEPIPERTAMLAALIHRLLSTPNAQEPPR